MATKAEIAEAVNDEEWQKFRLSLKGTSTETKLRKLREYLDANTAERDENVILRVDNYLKALARGGQIAPVIEGDYLYRLTQERLVIRK
jgi:hypothetical protein